MLTCLPHLLNYKLQNQEPVLNILYSVQPLSLSSELLNSYVLNKRTDVIKRTFFFVVFCFMESAHMPLYP